MERGLRRHPVRNQSIFARGENRLEPFCENPAGQCSSALVLDNGTVLAEITAICEHFDEIDGPPGTTPIGKTPEERGKPACGFLRSASIINILEPMANGFRYSDGLKMFENRIHCIPAAGADLKAIAQENLDCSTV